MGEALEGIFKKNCRISGNLVLVLLVFSFIYYFVHHFKILGGGLQTSGYHTFRMR
jgi:hypothetical protein